MEQTSILVYEKIQVNLNAAEFVCVTTDIWTSVNNESFVGITAHFLSEKQEKLVLSSHLSHCFSCEQRYTAQNLAAILGGNFIKCQ